MLDAYHPIITEITELELELGKSNGYCTEVFDDYRKACQYRDQFLSGSISFADYIDGLSSCSVDIDDYIDGISMALMVD